MLNKKYELFNRLIYSVKPIKKQDIIEEKIVVRYSVFIFFPQNTPGKNSVFCFSDNFKLINLCSFLYRV